MGSYTTWHDLLDDEPEDSAHSREAAPPGSPLLPELPPELLELQAERELLEQQLLRLTGQVGPDPEVERMEKMYPPPLPAAELRRRQRQEARRRARLAQMRAARAAEEYQPPPKREKRGTLRERSANARKRDTSPRLKSRSSHAPAHQRPIGARPPEREPQKAPDRTNASPGRPKLRSSRLPAGQVPLRPSYRHEARRQETADGRRRNAEQARSRRRDQERRAKRHHSAASELDRRDRAGDRKADRKLPNRSASIDAQRDRSRLARSEIRRDAARQAPDEQERDKQLAPAPARSRLDRADESRIASGFERRDQLAVEVRRPSNELSRSRRQEQFEDERRVEQARQHLAERRREQRELEERLDRRSSRGHSHDG